MTQFQTLHSQKLEIFSEAIEAFHLFARIEGRSPKTIKTYQDAFQDILNFVEGTVSLSQLTPGEFRRWIATRIDEGYAKSTINIRLRVLRTLFFWLTREGHIPASPLQHIKPLKVPQQYPYVLSELQAQALLRAINRHSWAGKRNWAMMLMFLDGMLRVSELINLDLGDVSLHAQSVHVRHGKGDKERVVFMGRKLTRAMQDWLQVRGHHIGEDRLFITRQGYKLTQRNVQRIIKRLAAKARIEGVRCSPHTLRHTGATLFIRNGGDPFSLQRLLGHSDISTTMIYVHMAGTALREAHAKASPVDRLLEG
ncbi:tyrosine-type recombinase/integrase [Candidatus Acetothermia bacterium]|nr:tyrosine-type recombinase/integrase [Candidatus Acetothermia bacterium]